MSHTATIKGSNTRKEALELALHTYGCSLAPERLLEIAERFEEYLKGPMQDAP